MMTNLCDHPAFGEAVRDSTEAEPQLGSGTEPKLKAREIARAAWGRLHSQQCWNDWRIVIAHLAQGSAIAMSLAHTNERKGQRYCAEFSAWLRDEGLDDISKTTRYNALQCADHFDVIEVFLDTLESDKRLKLNHPASVLAAWKRSQTSGKPLNPKVTLSAAWGAATAEERSAWVKKNEKNIFAAMSSEQRERLAQHVLNLHRKKPKFHEDLTDLFRKAWLHIDGGTCMEALACLRAIQRVAAGSNLKFDDLVVAVSKTNGVS